MQLLGIDNSDCPGIDRTHQRIPALYIFKIDFSINVEPPHPTKEQAGTLEHKWKMLGNRVYCYNCSNLLSFNEMQIWQWDLY